MRVLRSLLVLFLWPAVRSSADPVVHFEPEPSWIAPSPAPELTPTPDADKVHGYDYLLLDTQQRVATEETYAHRVYRVTSDSALQSAAKIGWNFDPSYEVLTLHHLRVIRDGMMQERLKPGLVQVIQQEKELDRHMLNGELTAFVVLEDVRVGDVIDYSFSRRGWNPVFAGRYFGTLTTAWSIPVRYQRERVVVPQGRRVLRQDHGSVGLTLTTTEERGATVLTWESRSPVRIAHEAEAPAWFDQYPWIELTEWADWGDVVDWAVPLYATPVPIPEEVQAKSAELTRGLETAEARTLALLRFVQQDVRYLGMELGTGSHRPNRPEVVLARRFGDCKDKTLLFCTLMRAAGLTAFPALVHSDYRDKISDWLPTPQAFDHVIACVEDEHGRHWVDPTLTHQAGGFDARGLPDYRLALVIRGNEKKFSPVTSPASARSTVRAEEIFRIPDFKQPARLRVRTRFTGLRADGVRRFFAENTPEQISKDYVNYYASAYPGLTAAALPVLTDEPARNVVTVEETYDVPALWQTRESDGVLVAEFYPKFITDFAVRPNTTVRTTPLRLSHPVDAELITTVHLPEDWSITPEQSRYDDEAFVAESNIRGAGREVTMRYRWTSRRDFVPADRVAQYVETLNRFRNGLGYTLTYRPAGASGGSKPFRLNWLYVLVDLATLAVLVWSARRLLRPSITPPPVLTSERDRTLQGIGGWLVLVAIGVTLRPLTLLVQSVRDGFDFYNFAVWEALTTPGNPAYREGFAPAVIGEHLSNRLLLGFSVICVILFYRRWHTFPRVFAAILLANPALLIVSGLVTQQWLGVDEKLTYANYSTAGRMLLAAAVWVPYIFRSRRVKLTFTR